MITVWWNAIREPKVFTALLGVSLLFALYIASRIEARNLNRRARKLFDGNRRPR